MIVHHQVGSGDELGAVNASGSRQRHYDPIARQQSHNAIWRQIVRGLELPDRRVSNGAKLPICGNTNSGLHATHPFRWIDIVR